MAKKIKFNLIIDDQPIRSVEDLKDNFNLQDILEVYKNGLLKRWLSVRGYNEYIEEVESLNLEDDIELLKRIVEIFDLDVSQQEIKRSVYSLEFIKEKNKRLDLINSKEKKWEKIISKYHKSYEEIVNNLIENKSDMSYIKEAVQEIYNKFLGLFYLNYKELYNELMEKRAIFPVIGILMNEELKNVLLSDAEIKSEIFRDIKVNINNSTYDGDLYYGANVKRITGSFNNETVVKKKVCIIDYHKVENDNLLEIKDNKNFYTDENIKYAILNKLIINSDNRNNFIKYVNYNDLISSPDSFRYNIKRFSGETNGYWEDIEAKGQKYLIISIENGNYIRNLGKTGEKLSSEDINGNFLILNGINYKSNNPNDELIYMEV